MTEKYGELDFGEFIVLSLAAQALAESAVAMGYESEDIPSTLLPLAEG